MDELTTLQDDVPEEKMDVQSLLSMQNFECIDAKPFASVSIGQVYRGRLKDGTEIVVKAKRSGIYERMQEDTDNLRTIIRFVEAIGVCHFVLIISLEQAFSSSSSCRRRLG